MINSYMPRGACMMWETPLVIWHTVTDLMVFIAFMVIPLFIFLIILIEVGNKFPVFAPLERAVGSIKYPSGTPWVIRLKHLGWLGAWFIFFCGIGHLIDVITVWYAMPWVKAVWNTGTALVSWMTAIAVIRHFPYFAKLIRQMAQFIKDNEGKELLET